jgi:hypothetical protein
MLSQYMPRLPVLTSFVMLHTSLFLVCRYTDLLGRFDIWAQTTHARLSVAQLAVSHVPRKFAVDKKGASSLRLKPCIQDNLCLLKPSAALLLSNKSLSCLRGVSPGTCVPP